MNLNIIFLLTISFTTSRTWFSPEALDFLYDYELDCMYQSADVTNEDIEELRTKHIVYDTIKMTKFSLCMLKKFNVVFPDDTINPDVSKYTMPRDYIEVDYATLRDCKEKGGKDFYEKVRNIMSCFLQRDQLVMAPHSRKGRDTSTNSLTEEDQTTISYSNLF